MKPLKRVLVLVLCLALVCQVGVPGVVSAGVKEIKVRGYITALTSPTAFEVEEYRVTREETVRFEFENQVAGSAFKPEDLRVGTFVELRGMYNEETGELKATKVKIDLKQFRALNVTSVLDRKPTELSKVEGDKWRGVVVTDGRRIRIEPETLVAFKLNKTEMKESEKQAKGSKATEAPKEKTEPAKTETAKAETTKTETTGPGKAEKEEGGDSDSEAAANASATPPPGKPDDEDESTAAEEAIGAGPLTSLADIGPGVIMTYEGKEQADGSVLASKAIFVKNELEKGEKDLWKSLKIKEKPANLLENKPAELKVGGDKYKLLPNQEVQDYVNRIGQSLIPAYQRNLPEGDPNKIPFKFVVIMRKGFNAAAYPNGVVLIHDDVFKLLENEAQLAAVLGHEIAHATQEHSYRQLQHNKKRRQAMRIASLFAMAAGFYAISNILDLVNAAMINGYGRTMENQADRVGLQYMTDAGYDPRESPRVWKLVSKKHGNMPTIFFWSSHDSNTERRSFQMLTIRNSFNSLDFSQLKKGDDSVFKKMVELAYEANPKNKKKVKAA